MPPRYVVLGGLRMDYLISAQGEVALRQCGGNALYAAAGAALWSEAVGIVSRAGTNYPSAWLDAAAAAGIDVSGVRRLPFATEMRTFFAHAPGGGRGEGDPVSHFARLGLAVPDELLTYTQPTADEADAAYAALRIEAEDVPADFRAAAAFHLAPMSYTPQLALAQALRSWGAPLITADPGEAWMTAEHRDDVARILACVDVFLPSEMELATLLGDTDAQRGVRWLAARGPRVVVIKRGAAGSLVYDAVSRQATHVPAAASRVRDVTGAGDAYCGGFLVGYAEGGDPVLAARRGAVSASVTVEGLGALYPLGTPHAELEQRLTRLSTTGEL